MYALQQEFHTQSAKGFLWLFIVTTIGMLPEIMRKKICFGLLSETTLNPCLLNKVTFKPTHTQKKSNLTSDLAGGKLENWKR